MAKSITYVGLDLHKDTMAVALAAAGLRGEVRQHGKIVNTPAAFEDVDREACTYGKNSAVLPRQRNFRSQDQDH